MKIKHEVVTYLISGTITTGVNYILYAGLLAVQVPYLTANSAAWAGAVLTAYILNRRWVFHSTKHIVSELAAFTSMRFLTLLTENIFLWLLISQIGTAAIPAKLIVSVVTVIGNYLLCKFKIFKKEVITHG